jgi:aminoglycoside 3-N-acetyltransferase
MSNDRLERLLDRLGIEEGDLVMLHTAFSRLRGIVNSPTEVIEGFTRRLGPSGMLAMPRYSWHLFPAARPWEGYAEFLRTLPPIDLRHTPANIGVVPEVFRQMPDVDVSISHFWPVAARGPRAKDLLQGQDAVIHAYGPGSVFARLLEWNAKIVGLGVTLNTSSVAPVTDLHLCSEHARNVFTDGPVSGVVIDRNGGIHRPRVTTMRPAAVRDIKPSRILAERLRPGIDFAFVEDNGNFFFSYEPQLYHEAALGEARAALKQGRALPWLN